MTMVAIDAGNTRIKWGVHDGEKWQHQNAFPTSDVDRLVADLAPWGAARSVVIANVAGERVARSLAAAVGSTGVEPYWVAGRAEQCGVRSGYADPAALGADRWAALIGARHLFAVPCVVVNAGTTMTVDALSSEAIFLGGIIVPGYALMRESLAGNTARLGLREGAFSFFPDNTGDAIASGALNALAGAVDRVCRYVVETGEDEPVIVLSGGNAELLMPRLNAQPQLVHNLVLEGLVRIGRDDI